MSKLSFTDKIDVLVEVSKSSKLFILVIGFLLFLGIVFLTSNKRNQKRTKMIYLVSVVFVIVFMIVTYHASLSSMFDYMMNNFFIVVYFPNLAIYLFAIIVTNIIMWISLFNYKTSPIIKKVNILIYIIINYLLCLLLYTININKLDVFTQSSVYGNKNAAALIDLSSTIFLVWIIFLIIYKCFLIYLRKDYKPKVRKVIVKRKVKKLPENFEPKEVPMYIYGKSPVKETPPYSNSNDELRKYEQLFTIDDYKLLLKMLKEQKEKERQEAEKLRIQKEREKQEQERLQEQHSEIAKFTELEELYRSIR